jgi:hypothetical protein
MMSGHDDSPAAFDPRQPAITLDKFRSAHLYRGPRRRFDSDIKGPEIPGPVLRQLSALVLSVVVIGAILGSLVLLVVPALSDRGGDDEAAVRSRIAVARVAYVYRWLEYVRSHG